MTLVCFERIYLEQLTCMKVLTKISLFTRCTKPLANSQHWLGKDPVKCKTLETVFAVNALGDKKNERILCLVHTKINMYGCGSSVDSRVLSTVAGLCLKLAWTLVMRSYLHSGLKKNGASLNWKPCHLIWKLPEELVTIT